MRLIAILVVFCSMVASAQEMWTISENPVAYDVLRKFYNEEGILTGILIYNNGKKYDQLESLTKLQSYVDSIGNKDLPELEYANILKILGYLKSTHYQNFFQKRRNFRKN